MSLNHQWKCEMIRFDRMSSCDKIGWLSYLSYWLSMFARDTYEVGTESLSNPSNLRRYNELLHRIASCQSAIYRNSLQLIPNHILFQIIEDEIAFLDIEMDVLIEKMSSLPVRFSECRHLDE